MFIKRVGSIIKGVTVKSPQVAKVKITPRIYAESGIVGSDTASKAMASKQAKLRAQRRPRITLLEAKVGAETERYKDHITGEILNARNVLERLSQGIYSRYHLQHLGLAS